MKTMKHPGKTGFITTAILLLFLTACGDGNVSKPSVTISITELLLVSVGETKTLNVKKQNTDDFTLSEVGSVYVNSLMPIRYKLSKLTIPSNIPSFFDGFLRFSLYGIGQLSSQ